MDIYECSVLDSGGNNISLEKYRDKVLLIVNTATKCGFTKQYTELESLYEKYHDKGFEILDFPCNQFAFQAPGSDEEIDSFCKINFNTKFPRFSKIHVNGSKTIPLYRYLKSKKKGMIKWNFTKFLISKNGDVLERFEPKVKPYDIEDSIIRALDEN